MALKVIAAASLATAFMISYPVLAGPNDTNSKKKPAEKKQSAWKSKDAGHLDAPALDFKVKNIDGEKVNLAKTYHGQVVMIVNVASQCGLTPQYKGLEELYRKYKDEGFVILGFPANNFGAQEPGTNEEIKEFCSSKYDVTFPMFAKVSVKGEDICPLFKYLTAKDAGHDRGGEIKWNFNKFLVGRDGKVIGRFEPRVDPMSDEVTSAISTALKAPKPEVAVESAPNEDNKAEKAPRPKKKKGD